MSARAEAGPADRRVKPAPVPAFPGAVGFGADTVGGRGGKILYVTNANDSGPGSLRAALEAAGPRIVIIAVSGTVILSSDIKVREPFLSVYGNKAPGGGLQTRGGMIVLKTHDVIVRYLKLRPGDEPSAGSSLSDRDALSLTCMPGGTGPHHIIVDHSSLMWGPDIGGFSATCGAHDITVQYSLSGEGILDGGHDDGFHSMGLNLAFDVNTGLAVNNATIYRNLIFSSNSRMPQFRGSGRVDFINNVVYNWGSNAGMGAASGLNLIGNTWRSGPASISTCAFSYKPITGGGDGPVYLDSEALDSGMAQFCGDLFTASTIHPLSLASDRITSAAHAYQDIVLDGDVGASLPQQDAADLRVLENVRSRTGGLINSPFEVGGWPDLSGGLPAADTDQDGMPDAWEVLHGFNPLGAADGPQDADGDIYTNVEEYLNDTDPGDAQNPTPAASSTPIQIPTATPSSTGTATHTPTGSPTATPTPSPFATFTETATASDTDTPTGTATATPTPILTETGTPTVMPTETETATPSATPDSTDIPTATPTDTFMPSPTPSVTATPAGTDTATPTGTATSLPPTPTATSTLTPTPLAGGQIKDITFEDGSLTHPVSGADSTSGSVLLLSDSSMKGVYAADFPTVASSYLQEDFASAADLYVSFYVRVNSLPSATARLATISNAGTNVGIIVLRTNGTLELRNGSATIGSPSAPLTVGGVYRVGLRQSRGTGTNAVLQAFVAAGDANFGAPFASTTTGAWTSPATRLRIGPASSNALDATVDDIRLDTLAMPGPSGGDPAPSPTPTGPVGPSPTATRTPTASPTPTASATPTQTSTPSGTRIKNITFEDGSLTHSVSGADSTSGTVVLDSSFRLKGRYSADIPGVASSYLQENFTAVDVINVSFYMRLDARPSSSVRLILLSNSGTAVGNLLLRPDGTLQLRNGTTVIGSASAPLTPGTLYRVGIRQQRGSGGNAILQAFLATADDVFGLPFASTSTGTWTSQANRVRVGATTSNALDAFLDDIRLDTSAMPGPSP